MFACQDMTSAPSPLLNQRHLLRGLAHDTEYIQQHPPVLPHALTGSAENTQLSPLVPSYQEHSCLVTQNQLQWQLSLGDWQVVLRRYCGWDEMPSMVGRSKHKTWMNTGETREQSPTRQHWLLQSVLPKKAREKPAEGKPPRTRQSAVLWGVGSVQSWRSHETVLPSAVIKATDRGYVPLLAGLELGDHCWCWSSWQKTPQFFPRNSADPAEEVPISSALDVWIIHTSLHDSRDTQDRTACKTNGLAQCFKNITLLPVHIVEYPDDFGWLKMEFGELLLRNSHKG